MNKKEVRKHIAIIHNMAKDYGLLDNEEISRTYQVIDYISNLEQENKEQEEYIKYWQNEYDKKVEIIDKAIENIKKELKENNHLSYGVALSVISILNNYEEIIKG